MIKRVYICTCDRCGKTEERPILPVETSVENHDYVEYRRFIDGKDVALCRECADEYCDMFLKDNERRKKARKRADIRFERIVEKWWNDGRGEEE